MTRLVDEIREISRTYEERKAAALELQRQEQARRDSEWELQTVRGAKEKIFPEIIDAVRECANSGLYRHSHELMSSIGETNKYLDLLVPTLTRMLEDAGFQVSHSKTKVELSLGMSLTSPQYAHHLTIDW